MPDAVRFSKGSVTTPKWTLRLAFISLFTFTFLSQTSHVFAHPADMYFQTFDVTLAPDHLDIKWTIKPGPILANYLWTNLDIDQNGLVDPNESKLWGEQTAALLSVEANSTSLEIQYQGLQFPTAISTFQTGDEFIVFNFAASLPQSASNRQHLRLHSRFEEKTSISWFYLTAEGDSAFMIPNQRGGELEIDFFKDRAQAIEETNLLNKWDSGSPSLPAGQKKDTVTTTAEQIIPELKQNTPQEILTDLVKQEQFSLSFYLFALAIAIGLGALHALTPGHGKTVVAAYLVGSRGTTKHAVALGSIVTLTHTGSVFLLGIVTLVASRYFLPTKLIPILEVASGFLIVGLGISLLYSRWKAWRNGAGEHAHGHEHDHGHDHHTHSHDGHAHNHDMPRQLSWRSLAALGVSGGLVPCPDAVAILLVAIAINRILLGLILIMAFSLGLAAVLIVIGLAMVHSARLFHRMGAFNKFAPALPMVSAAAVIILGIALSYGALGKIFDRVNTPETAADMGSISETSSGQTQIVFLGLDPSGERQVMVKELMDGSVRTLTNSKRGISYFALSPDHKRILYVPYREDQGSDIWVYDLNKNENQELVSCVDYICSQAAWSPDESRLVYEKLSLSAGPDSLGAPSIWWVDATTGASKSVFQDSQLPGYNPRWSPDGEWLSYSVPGGGIHVQNLNSGANRIISTSISGPAYWSPDSKSFLFNDGYVQNDKFITRLYLYDLANDEVKNLSHNLDLEDSLAAWSPDGKRIAVVRRETGATMGDQIWVMDSDGGSAYALTESPAVIHDGLSWSPNGQFLLAHSYALDKPLSEPMMIMIELKTDKITELGEGLRPTWLTTN